MELGNLNYKDTTDPECEHCKGRGFEMCSICGFHTCIFCNPEGDHRQSLSEIIEQANKKWQDL